MIGAEDETLRPTSLLPTSAGDDTLESRPAGSSEPGRPARGTVIGRYVVLAELGAGAMGRVYAAYDPKLDRRVALKVLRLDRDDEELFRRAERRLLREAQALARLSHPNVVTVHDVETWRGSLVVAMDFIEGRTLRRWLGEGSRAWPEIVAMVAQAGEGLAAAHRAGMVHRDFKPDNVMISEDGRAHVVDFGLARVFEASTLSEEIVVDQGEPEPERVPEPGATCFTRSQGRAGTPAYMAPEQHLGRGVGPASDQFALCVVLYEALWGRRPFPGNDLITLTTAVLEGRLLPPPRDSEVPARIREAVLHGLAIDPAQRHSSVDALLVELRSDPAARRRTIATIAGGLGLVAVAAFGYLDDDEPRGPAPCTGGASKAAEAWGDDARARAEAAVLATGTPYAAHGWAQAVARLDAYAASWAREHDEACAATRLRGEQSEQRLDLRMACLARHHQQLAATARLLREADAEVVERLVPIVTGLPPLRECSDPEALTAAVPPPRDPEVREQVESVRASLARAEALGLAGKYEVGLREASGATELASRLGYAPALAEALLLRGWLEDRRGDSATAELSLSAAAFSAERARHDAVAARATSELSFVVGAQLGRIDEGLMWARHADAAAGRLGDPLVRARQLNNRAVVLTTAGRLAESRIDLQRALALRERELPPDHPDIATTRINLGIALDGLGRFDEARAAYERALDEYLRTLGPDHPRVAGVLVTLGNLLVHHGEIDQAEAQVRRAIAIYEATVGPVHPHLASAFNNLAVVHHAQDDDEAALEDLGRALTIWEQVFPPGHPEIGDGYFNRGGLLFELDRREEARGDMERALAIYEAAYGPDHPDVGGALLNLGLLELDEQRYARALAHHRRMLEILRDTLPPDHPELAKGLSVLARSCLSAGSIDEAERAADESLRIFEQRAESTGRSRAQARYLRARARWEAGHDRRAALAEARRALDEALDDDEIRDEVTRWLAELGSPVPGR
ncbi:MAG: serine/threonine protein kinase [Myxococcales bacterium]|nr:serine/threonine protein kinase [Myxococcales bacterium]MCB9714535.1 serine/threonine protein kinase [Myxococcales bacterium]